MKHTIQTALLIMITAIMLGCGTTDDEQKSNISIENLLSTGVLSGTTTSTMDSQNTDVKVSKENGTYKVEYPSLQCKGTLSIISTSETEMIFKINFTEGSCLSGTKLKLTDVGNNQVAINEYSPDTVVETTPNTNTDDSVPYKSFALNNGRFTSSSSNRPDAYTILSSNDLGKDIIVDYTNVHCNAKWKQITSPSLNTIRFRETITHGTCTNNKVIEVRKTPWDKQLRLTFFKPDGIKKINTQAIYYHNKQASYATHTISSQFSIKKSYNQYGSFILNHGRFSSSSSSRPDANTVLHSFNAGKDIIVDYTHVHCNAKWTSIVSPSQNAIRFKETITYGTCTDNKIIEIRKTPWDKQIKLTYFRPDGIKQTSTQTLYNHNDQVSTAILEDARIYTPVVQQQSNNQIQRPTINQHISNDATTQYISSQLNQLITYTYSYARGGIFAIGKKNGTYSFYRFGTNPLELEKSFYDIGINSNATINSIRAERNGSFLIYTNHGNYRFNYFNDSSASHI